MCRKPLVSDLHLWFLGLSWLKLNYIQTQLYSVYYPDLSGKSGFKSFSGHEFFFHSETWVESHWKLGDLHLSFLQYFHVSKKAKKTLRGSIYHADFSKLQHFIKIRGKLMEYARGSTQSTLKHKIKISTTNDIQCTKERQQFRTSLQASHAYGLNAMHCVPKIGT